MIDFNCQNDTVDKIKSKLTSLGVHLPVTSQHREYYVKLLKRQETMQALINQGPSPLGQRNSYDFNRGNTSWEPSFTRATTSTGLLPQNDHLKSSQQTKEQQLNYSGAFQGSRGQNDSIYGSSSANSLQSSHNRSEQFVEKENALGNSSKSQTSFSSSSSSTNKKSESPTQGVLVLNKSVKQSVENYRRSDEIKESENQRLSTQSVHQNRQSESLPLNNNAKIQSAEKLRKSHEGLSQRSVSSSGSFSTTNVYSSLSPKNPHMKLRVSNKINQIQIVIQIAIILLIMLGGLLVVNQMYETEITPQFVRNEQGDYIILLDNTDEKLQEYRRIQLQNALGRIEINLKVKFITKNSKINQQLSQTEIRETLDLEFQNNQQEMWKLVSGEMKRKFQKTQQNKQAYWSLRL